jgi:Phosphoribosylformylglycinamidine (FGAM) synthase
MTARVFVTLKKAVLDPQGKAVQRSLARLGFPEARDVRVGRLTITRPLAPTAVSLRGKIAREEPSEAAATPTVGNSAPNKGLELTAYSVRSCVAPASSSSSGLAVGFFPD